MKSTLKPIVELSIYCLVVSVVVALYVGYKLDNHLPVIDGARQMMTNLIKTNSASDYAYKKELNDLLISFEKAADAESALLRITQYALLAVTALVLIPLFVLFLVFFQLRKDENTT